MHHLLVFVLLIRSNWAVLLRTLIIKGRKLQLASTYCHCGVWNLKGTIFTIMEVQISKQGGWLGY